MTQMDSQRHSAGPRCVTNTKENLLRLYETPRGVAKRNDDGLIVSATRGRSMKTMQTKDVV